MRHQGTNSGPRGTLARDVWKETARTTSLDNVIDVRMPASGAKSTFDQGVKLIHTVRGCGLLAAGREPGEQ